MSNHKNFYPAHIVDEQGRQHSLGEDQLDIFDIMVEHENGNGGGNGHQALAQVAIASTIRPSSELPTA